MSAFYYDYCNKTYVIACEDNKLIIICDGVERKEYREIKVIDNSHYFLKENKNSLSAAGGSYGLWSKLKKCAENDSCITYIQRIINKLYSLYFDGFKLTDKELLYIQCGRGTRGMFDIIRNHGFNNPWSAYVAEHSNYLFFTYKKEEV